MKRLLMRLGEAGSYELFFASETKKSLTFVCRSVIIETRKDSQLLILHLCNIITPALSFATLQLLGN